MGKTRDGEARRENPRIQSFQRGVILWEDKGKKDGPEDQNIKLTLRTGSLTKERKKNIRSTVERRKNKNAFLSSQDRKKKSRATFQNALTNKHMG